MFAGWVVAAGHLVQNIACVQLSDSYQWTECTNTFVKYCFRDSPEVADVSSSFISDSALKMYSSTFKILHDRLQPIFSDDSENDDDPENQGRTRSDGTIQARNKVQMNKKPNIVSALFL
jgi:hypothetical protein